MSKHPLAPRIKTHTAFFLAVIVTVGSLMGCSHSQADLRSDQYPLSPNARFYSYLMINGIAQGAFLTGEKGKDELPAIEEEDKKARKAVLLLMKNEKENNEFQTDITLIHYLSEIRSSRL